jgi:hypothetical protein
MNTHFHTKLAKETEVQYKLIESLRLFTEKPKPKQDLK